MIALFCLTLAIFHRVLFLGETYFAGDILSEYYPTRYFIQKWLKQGVFPFWCPQIFKGFPLIATSNSGIFNPLERIFFGFFAPGYAYNLNIAAHYFIGALSMYALVNYLTKNKEAAFISAVSFAYSGFFFVYLNYVTVFSMCYIPLAILLAFKCFTKASCKQKQGMTRGLFFANLRFDQATFGTFNFAREKVLSLSDINRPTGLPPTTTTKTLDGLAGYKSTLQRPRYVCQLIIVLGIQLFAGGAQYTFFTLIAIVLLAGFFLVWPQKGTKQQRLAPLFLLVLIIAGFLLFTAAQTMPTFELIKHSIRKDGVEKDIWQRASLPLKHLITIIIPHYWGEMYRFGSYQGEWNFIDLNCYLGITPLLLAFIPLFMKKKPAGCYYFYIITAFSLIYALGKYNPLYEFLYYLPIFKSFRYPGRILVLFIFGMAVNAGFGYKMIRERLEVGRLKIALYTLTAVWLSLAVISFIFIKQTPELSSIRMTGWYKMNLYFILGLIPLYWQVFKGINKHILTGWLVAIILIDNLLFGYPFNPTVSKDIWDYKPLLNQEMKNDNQNYSIFAAKNLAFYAVRRSTLQQKNNMAHLIDTNLELFQGNTALLTPYRTFNGYSQLELYEHYAVNESLGLNQKSYKNKSFLKHSNIKYLVRWNKQPIKNVKPHLSGQNSLLYQLNEVSPRAYFAASHLVLPSPLIALKLLNSENFNANKQVILSREPGVNYVNQPATLKHTKVEFREMGPNAVRTDIQAPQAGWLVLNDSYYPGWKAYVDGIETEIFKANLLFRAIPIKAGNHQVIWRYQPKSWYYGILISSITLIFLSIIIFKLTV